MHEQLEKFGVYLLVRRGLQPYTIVGYQGGVRRFLTKTTTLAPTIEQVENYIAQMRQANSSYNHVINTSLALERYMEFLGTPLRLGRPKKPRRTIKDTLSEAEIARLIGACKNIRERAILVLLAYSGIRAKEMCNLKVTDLNIANQSLYIRAGKGNKDRLACIPSECLAIALEYLTVYPRATTEHLFTTLQKNNLYTTSSLRKLVKVVATRMGFTKRVYPHLFRHSLATNMLNRGAAIYTIQQQLGHAFMETTMVYLHPTLRRIRNEYLFYVPNYI
jgi:integrase/recombinase XerD